MSLLQLHFQLDPRGGLPVYRQLMDQIRYYIASGVLAAGDQLPSIRDMARALQVNPTTIVKTYSELEHAGVLERQQGKGVFVQAGVPKASAAVLDTTLRRQVRQLVVEAQQMGATAEQVAALFREEWEHLQLIQAREAAE